MRIRTKDLTYKTMLHKKIFSRITSHKIKNPLNDAFQWIFFYNNQVILVLRTHPWFENQRKLESSSYSISHHLIIQTSWSTSTDSGAVCHQSGIG